MEKPKLSAVLEALYDQFRLATAEDLQCLIGATRRLESQLAASEKARKIAERAFVLNEDAHSGVGCIKEKTPAFDDCMDWEQPTDELDGLDICDVCRMAQAYAIAEAEEEADGGTPPG